MWDITFCSKKDCTNKECKRNQSNVTGSQYISIADLCK